MKYYVLTEDEFETIKEAVRSVSRMVVPEPSVLHCAFTILFSKSATTAESPVDVLSLDSLQKQVDVND